MLEGDQFVEVGCSFWVAEGLEQVPLAHLVAGGEGDLAAGDGVGAFHGEQPLVDRSFDAGGWQLAQELAGDRVARSPRQVDDSRDPHLLGDGEHLPLEADHDAGVGLGVLDVAPAAIGGFVLVGGRLRLALLLGSERVVVAEDRIDFVARVVLALAGKAVGQIPALGQVVMGEQAVIALVTVARRRDRHPTILANPIT